MAFVGYLTMTSLTTYLTYPSSIAPVSSGKQAVETFGQSFLRGLSFLNGKGIIIKENTYIKEIQNKQSTGTY